MTTSNSNRQTSNIDDPIVEMGNGYSSAASALYYPSLAEIAGTTNCCRRATSCRDDISLSRTQ